MKKIGIITIVKVNNYGAELQALATQHVIEQMDYEAEIINYLYYKHPRHISTKGAKPLFPVSMMKRVEEWLFPRINILKQMLFYNNVAKLRRTRFETFHKENTKFSCEYRTAESLFSNSMDYDVYLVGSDQVWNPNNYTSLNPYFLRFAPKNKLKISYASSFGVSELPNYTYAYYQEALRWLNAVSVREENAVQLVEEVAGIKAQWVLDPTLLLNGEEWMHYAKEVTLVPTRFVLIYEVTPCAYLKELALNIAKELGCEVVRLNCEAARKEKDEEIINVMDAGPAEFIWLFGKASMVVTNSFHGTAFSLNMQKDFFVVTPARKQNNSRQKSLLRLVGLEHRNLVEGTQVPNKEKYSVDYSKVNPLLETARVKSMDYLKNAIGG